MAKSFNHEKENRKNGPQIIHTTTRLWFGKYKGKTLEEIDDRPYFIYLLDNTSIPMTTEVIKYTFEKKT